MVDSYICNLETETVSYPASTKYRGESLLTVCWNELKVNNFGFYRLEIWTSQWKVLLGHHNFYDSKVDYTTISVDTHFTHGVLQLVLIPFDWCNNEILDQPCKKPIMFVNSALGLIGEFFALSYN